MSHSLSLLAAAALGAVTTLGVVGQDRPKRDVSRVFTMKELSAKRAARGGPYFSFLEVPAMSCGVYELAKGARDGQQPHERDEIYAVMKGKATFVGGTERTKVEPGSIIYVPRGAEHRFEEITEDLSLLVVFAGR